MSNYRSKWSLCEQATAFPCRCFAAISALSSFLLPQSLGRTKLEAEVIIIITHQPSRRGCGGEEFTEKMKNKFDEENGILRSTIHQIHTTARRPIHHVAWKAFHQQPKKHQPHYPQRIKLGSFRVIWYNNRNIYWRLSILLRLVGASRCSGWSSLVAKSFYLFY